MWSACVGQCAGISRAIATLAWLLACTAGCSSPRAIPDAGLRPTKRSPSKADGGGGAAARDAASIGKTALDAGKGVAAGRDAAAEPVVWPVGRPGCGLEHAAFCDTFNAPASERGRAGDLDVRFWSGGRMQPQLPTGSGASIAIAPATIPSCRADTAQQVLPDADTLICDPNADIDSHHLLVAVAAQNYGQNSYRIRQPFDFKDRTGTIVFDADAYVVNTLLGWVSVEVSEDPTTTPSFALLDNDEGAIIPRNGVEVQLQTNCPDAHSTTVRMIAVYDEYKSTILMPNNPPCIPTQEGKLNHFEVSVSQTRVEVRGTPFSADGKSFDPPVLLYAADVQLPFSRGYVSITVHNHATIKYSKPGGRASHPYDAWVARWDDVGFDGPVVSNYREYEVPDSLVPMDAAMNIAYRVADIASGPSHTLHIPGVDLTDVTSARLTLSGWYLKGSNEKYVLHYRFNGHPFRDRPLTAGEVFEMSDHNQGAIAQLIDVQLEDLVQGDNTLEFVTENVPQNYPPAVLNIDLVLATAVK
jgi:hypothetical protein